MKRSKSGILLCLLDTPEKVSVEEKEELLGFIRRNYCVTFCLRDLYANKEEVLEFLRKHHEEYITYLKDIMIR